LCDASAKPTGIAAFVGQQMFEWNAADQVLGLEDAVTIKRTRLPRASTPALIFVLTRPPETPERLIFAPLFTAAACWLARTMMGSMFTYLKSGFSINALEIRSHTPSFAHRPKRGAVFQWPKPFG
jgi:hypothetical protein